MKVKREFNDLHYESLDGSFEWAIKLCKKGFRLRRDAWKDGIHLYWMEIKNNQILKYKYSDTMGISFKPFEFTNEDVFTNDWKVIILGDDK